MLLAVLVVLLVILPVPVVLDAGGIDIDITSWLKSGSSTEQGMVMGVCVLMSFFLFCNFFFELLSCGGPRSYVCGRSVADGKTAQTRE